MIRGDVVTGVMSFAEMDSNYNKNGIKFKWN
jgi:hypothetical protein